MEENKILDGKAVSKKIKDELCLEVEKLKANGINPKLAVIMVGNDPASSVYVKNKSKACEYVGVEFKEYLLKEDTEEQELLCLIDELNKDSTVNRNTTSMSNPKTLKSK